MTIYSEGNNLKTSYTSINRFPFGFNSINHPGDYEKENIVFQVKEDIDSLQNYMLIYFVESIDTGLPDYERIRILTFDDLKIEKGTLLLIYTCSCKCTRTIRFENSDQTVILHWGLPKPIWSIPLSSYELIHRNNSIGGGILRD